MSRQIFRNGTVIDVLDGTAAVGTVVVEDGLISEVSSSEVAAGADDQVFDCTGQTLSPGLIDCHAHLHYKDVTDTWSIELSKPIEAATIDCVHDAAVLLETGFTTIREVGTRGAITPNVRDGINAGLIRGPRIFSSGRIIGVRAGLTDWHPDHLFNRRQYDHSMGMWITGPWEARLAVREQVKDRVDFIKAEASGTGFNPYAPTDLETISEEELGAIVSEAAAKNMGVAVHAESTRSIQMAARLGVASIEHGVRMDKEACELMLENGVTLSPTLSFFMETMERGGELGLAPEMVEQHARDHERHVASFRMAYEAGIPIVAGGDAGLAHFPQGSCVKEPVRYLEVSDMTPMEALQTITINGAKLMGFEEITGSLTAGKSADMVIYADNPLDDMKVLGDASKRLAVYKEGRFEAGKGLVSADAFSSRGADTDVPNAA
jgi:imidazolonepropionase-like amidohydrolase